MESNDFFCLCMSKNKAILIGLLCCFMLPANAEPPPPEAFEQKSELILTLSDKWLETNTNANGGFYKLNRTKRKHFIVEHVKPKSANIGCDMDVNQNASSDSSLTSRIVGECNFNYHY